MVITGYYYTNGIANFKVWCDGMVITAILLTLPEVLVRGVCYPLTYSMFLQNGLINELQECNHGISIDDFKLNNVTYADDITLICSSIAGLQSLIDICVSYSVKWNFNF